MNSAECAEMLTAGQASQLCETTVEMWNAEGMLDEDFPAVFHKVSKILYLNNWKWFCYGDNCFQALGHGFERPVSAPP